MSEPSSAVRIGIDVGGTFTHAVAIDTQTLTIVGRSKVPTTHSAAEGVAKGIIHSLHELLDNASIPPDSVKFIAHSTTQATNALLEGDVAAVGIIGMGSNSWLSKANTNIGSIELAPGKFLKTHFQFVDTSKGFQPEAIKQAIEKLRQSGAAAIAFSEAFAVDNADNELKAMEVARQLGMPCTSGSQVSKLYGLKVRTRTAVINAAMLPKMIETADMTEASVREAGIKAPIMIMRSDGGVMDIDAMRQRPILTMLSGPAAGVAAAMMYLNISDGIFLEVGGTSTDISVIRNGKALVKSAEIGGHRVYMRTLDVKTIGVAGGSMYRSDGKSIIAVGPRSAHIAGLHYVAFSEPLAEPQFLSVQPKPADPPDYQAIKRPDENTASLCLTPTCAANFLGLVPEGDCAFGNQAAVTAAFTALSKQLHGQPQELAEAALHKAYLQCLPTIKQFINDYKLDPQTLSLIGGGGGAAALVPYIGKEMGLQHTLAENADVISAIGVALALVRETVERNIVQPKQDDILRIRQEALDAVQKMGADPASTEVHVEVDSRANVVRATAFGAAGLSKSGAGKHALTEKERQALAAKSLAVPVEQLKSAAKTAFFEVFTADIIDRKLLGLLRSKHQSLRTMDDKGVIRLQTRNGVLLATTADKADRAVVDLAEQHSSYGDAGKILPNMMLLIGGRIVDLSGLQDPTQLAGLARAELSSVPTDTPAIVIAGLE